MDVARLFLQVALILTSVTLADAAPPGSRPVEGSPRRHLSTDTDLLSSLELRLSTGDTAVIHWNYNTLKYALTVPAEAVAVAVVAQVGPQQDQVDMALYRPEDARREVLFSEVPSAFADVPTEEAARLILEIRSASIAINYTISVLRSTITAHYQFTFPDPAELMIPESTLTGLTVVNLFGQPVRLRPTGFNPRRSQYIASVEMTMDWVRVVASNNDPEGSLSIRANGEEWQPLEAGRTSRNFAVPERAWLLLGILVESPTAAAAGLRSLVYEVVVAREVLCHVRCSSCFGPGEDECLVCRPPLVLSDGFCNATACPSTSYFEGLEARCLPCDASCAQCTGPGAEACSLCPALHFLAPQAWTDRVGPCVIECPAGTFAHPPSRRCRSPPSVVAKTFYLRFLFRVGFEAFQHDERLHESVRNTTVFVLGVSLSDVKVHEVGSRDGYLQMIVEVLTPFRSKGEADGIIIDAWFAAFGIPVDEVMSLTWDEVHPPPLPVPVPPFLPMWGWGFIASAAAASVVSFIFYCSYFRRLKNIKKKYKSRKGIDWLFIDRVVNQSPPWIIRQFIAFESGVSHHLAQAKGA